MADVPCDGESISGPESAPDYYGHDRCPVTRNIYHMGSEDSGNTGEGGELHIEWGTVGEEINEY